MAKAHPTQAVASVLEAQFRSGGMRGGARKLYGLVYSSGASPPNFLYLTYQDLL